VSASAGGLGGDQGGGDRGGGDRGGGDQSFRDQGGGDLRSGFAAVLGRPNVGKSTLVNRLVGSKVSIISDHPQTTRRRISGVVTRPGLQIVLLDLPGFQKPFDSLTRRMQKTVDDTLTEVDAALVMLNAAEVFGAGDAFVVRAAAAAAVPAVYVLNKVDAVDGRRRRMQLAAAAALAGGADVLAVSALTGEGAGGVLEQLAAAMPAGPLYFPEGQTSDQPLAVLIAELIREQALRATREEVPHAIAVEVESIEERPGGRLVEVEARLVVEHESQKAILVGKNGTVIKHIGSAARHEIEGVLGAHVYLGLRVKVRRRWRRDDAYLERNM
jgi:GTP-binding protein Era